jgi:hypothetical protein
MNRVYAFSGVPTPVAVSKAPPNHGRCVLEVSHP